MVLRGICVCVLPGWLPAVCMAVMLLAITNMHAIKHVHAQNNNNQAYFSRYSSPSRSASSLSLPYVDVRDGLSAWFCFNGNSADCSGKSIVATPHAAGFTNRMRAHAKLARSKNIDNEATLPAQTALGPQLTTDRFNRQGYAYAFNRSNGDYFSISASGNFILPSRGVSVTAWLRLSSVAPLRFTLLSRNFPTFTWLLDGHAHVQRVGHERTQSVDSSTCPSDAQLSVYKQKFTDLQLTGTSPQGANATKTVSVTPIPANQWMHVATVIDGCNQFFYVNGVLKDIASNPFSFVSDDGTGHWAIGSGGCGPQCDTFDGSLDDVRVYSRALQPNEVKRVWGACDACQNGGQCSHTGTTFTCKCSNGFTGPTCAIKQVKAKRKLHSLIKRIKSNTKQRRNKRKLKKNQAKHKKRNQKKKLNKKQFNPPKNNKNKKNKKKLNQAKHKKRNQKKKLNKKQFNPPKNNKNKKNKKKLNQAKSVKKLHKKKNPVKKQSPSSHVIKSSEAKGKKPRTRGRPAATAAASVAPTPKPVVFLSEFERILGSAPASSSSSSAGAPIVVSSARVHKLQSELNNVLAANQHLHSLQVQMSKMQSHLEELMKAHGSLAALSPSEQKEVQQSLFELQQGHIQLQRATHNQQHNPQHMHELEEAMEQQFNKQQQLATMLIQLKQGDAQQSSSAIQHHLSHVSIDPSSYQSSFAFMQALTSPAASSDTVSAPAPQAVPSTASPSPLSSSSSSSSSPAAASSSPALPVMSSLLSTSESDAVDPNLDALISHIESSSSTHELMALDSSWSDDEVSQWSSPSLPFTSASTITPHMQSTLSALADQHEIESAMMKAEERVKAIALALQKHEMQSQHFDAADE